MRIGLIPCLAAMFLAVLPASHAADWYTGAASSSRKMNRDFGVSIDGSVAATSQNAVHVSIIGTIAPFTGIKQTGMRMRIGGLVGSYKYIASAAGVGSVTGNETSASFLGGYEWVMPGTSVGIFGGAEFQNRTISKPDPNNTVTGTAFGFKMALDVFSNPTPYTMVSGNFTYSTNHSAYYARLKAGMAFFGNVFLGPEMLFLGDSFYGQWRFGAHMTGFKVGTLQFGVSGGYVSDRKNGGGGYAILDGQVRF